MQCVSSHEAREWILEEAVEREGSQPQMYPVRQQGNAAAVRTRASTQRRNRVDGRAIPQPMRLRATKSRGRLDRTLVLGCCGAAAQNAGSRPGLPLNAPDTAAGTCPRGTRLRKNTPGTKKSSQPRAGVWTPSDGRVKRTHMQTFTRAEGLPSHTCMPRENTTTGMTRLAHRQKWTCSARWAGRPCARDPWRRALRPKRAPRPSIMLAQKSASAAATPKRAFD